MKTALLVLFSAAALGAQSSYDLVVYGGTAGGAMTAITGARMGLKVETMSSGGGCDANIFNKRGIECANFGTGMRAIHTVKEWLDVKDLYQSAEIALEVLKLNGELAAQNR
jgi:acetylornithine deacetylase/succinyl-diaminopimelate desuccinylase-like protein